MTPYRNPFTTDADRAQIWEMLVERDIRSFMVGDWDLVADDFHADSFVAVDGRMRSNPDSWRLGFRALDDYRRSWLEQSTAMRELVADGLETGLYEASTVRDIEIDGDRALAHKKIDGQVRRKDGSIVPLSWQTLYLCRKFDDRWRIIGFVGYLPNPMGDAAPAAPATAAKQVPASARQHTTAGPYSPVLSVRADKLAVISGQAAIASDGSVIGKTVEEQARETLDNCARQLASAGCTLGDVFKVNVYLSDISLWERFNSVYREMMPGTLPVRTAVGTQLLDGLLVEVEMWAVQP
ncbi:RidA family protein [Streptomyces luteolus]|uniref:RidA family protein n=1 Tax=Streptomyces luteolus TaxID=3043615 RepID=A0ABT6SU30_9ACTN|nr:RidA family protein [Streptomyces sp. B-S-A12]MDI3418735.1 RidA family protein [Streptomyces sp. B-S-A12]